MLRLNRTRMSGLNSPALGPGGYDKERLALSFIEVILLSVGAFDDVAYFNSSAVLGYVCGSHVVSQYFEHVSALIQFQCSGMAGIFKHQIRYYRRTIEIYCHNVIVFCVVIPYEQLN